jgi:NAD(P)-dependent dehydrogenase (short-subunit alcohol dehydrogenase family)
MDLASKGKKVSLTGGSKGIGRSIPESFLREFGEVYPLTADLSDAAAAVEFTNWAATEMGNPLRRLGRPEEIEEAVVFEASERSSFMLGANLPVDDAATTSLQL